MRIFRAISRFSLLSLLVVGLASVGRAQLAMEPSRTLVWEKQLQSYIKALASDSMEGRRTGTRGNMIAARYISDRFAEFGLVRPQGKGMEGYFHPFEYTTGIDAGERNSASLWPEGNSRQATNPQRMELEMGKDFVPLGFSEAGTVSGEIVFVGYGIAAPELNYDDYAGIDARGKIVLMMRYSPDGTNPHGEFASHAAFARKVIVAREHGAAGMIVIDPPADDDALVPMRLDRSFTNAGIVAVSMRGSIFDYLRDPRGRRLAQVQRAIDSTKSPASFVAPGEHAALTVSLKVLKAMVPNVVGILPGADPKLREEFVVIGAHFDHLGRGGEGSLGTGDSSIHYGADDNGSGTAGLLALAEHFARTHSNRRSIIFAAFNGEEEGLLGSAALVANPPFLLDKVIAMINMDMIGRLDSNALVVQGIGTSPVWRGVVDSINHGRFDLSLMDDGYGPSDHTSFYLKEIPVIFFFTGNHRDYHRPSDTWEKINYPGTARVIDLVADITDWLTAYPERLPFTKTQNSAARSSMGFRVYVGTIPDYAYDGKGVRLSGVAQGGPAEKGGLQEGDIIIRMGTKEINNIYDYTYALGEFRPKQHVEIEFLRAGSSKTATVELGSR